MMWKRETWLKGNPKRTKVVRALGPVFTFFFIRATKPWLQQNGVRHEYLHNMDWRVKKDSLHKRRFSWIECIHPFCISSLRHNLAVVLHPKQNVGKPLSCKGNKCGDVYHRDPLYKLVDCKKETTLPLAQRVAQCSKMKALRYKMNEKEKFESKGYWEQSAAGKRTSESVSPELELVPMEPPSCAAKAEIALYKCNTCCCPAGLITTSVKFSMVAGSQYECGAWLAFADWTTRTVMSIMRTVATTDVLGPRCMQGAAADNPNVRGSEVNKQYCKAKVGGTGKHLHECGGNQASLTESSTEVQDLGEGRRGKASTIRRGGGGLRATGSFSFGAARFQGNHEEELGE